MVHSKIEAFDKQAVQLRNQLAILQVDRRQTLGELVQEALGPAPFRLLSTLRPRPEDSNSHALIEGHWPCPDNEGEGRQGPPHSPTGKCLYVVGDDENCLFCRLPLERQ